MKRSVSYVIILLALVLTFPSCNRGPKVTRTDTITSGNASVVCEDCFAPIIDEEIQVFEGLNGNAQINPVYTNEVDAMKLFLKDSIRLIIAARDLTPAESQSIRSRNLIPRSCKIATDGIALIINRNNRDSIISVSSLKKIFAGDIQSWNKIYPGSGLGKIKVVFDNPNSSTVRYIKDSISGGRPFGKNIRAMNNNQAVIDFVAKTPNALGVIGVNWISNRKDTTNLSFTEKIRVMSVSPYDDARADNSYQPYAAYLALAKYPLTRDIYVIISDIAGGLPSGFMQFITGDKGQRIILKAGLVPATRPTRLISVRDKI